MLWGHCLCLNSYINYRCYFGMLQTSLPKLLLYVVRLNDGCDCESDSLSLIQILFDKINFINSLYFCIKLPFIKALSHCQKYVFCYQNIIITKMHWIR